ncbi:MAG TPA: NAD-glutamate dehydrogenase, partial [Alphaproteobacteria bacterium]|nr:NAD-glutamate dehydrogenase [Alphaproteobacteria bacterium]
APAFAAVSLPDRRVVLEVAAVYFKVGDRLQFDWLRDAAMRANKQTHWDRMALAAILEELDMQQNALTISILQNKSKSKATAEFLIEEWGKQHQTAWEDTQNLLSDLRKVPNIDLAKLVIVSQQLKLLLA